MLNFSAAFAVYMIEMLIAYIVFSSVARRKYNVFLVLLSGIFIFGSAVVVNLLFSNNGWINGIYTLIINFLFGFLCFQFTWLSALVYAFLMALLSAVTEIITVFSVSSLLGLGITAYNSNNALLFFETIICKTLYLIASIFLLCLPKKSKSPVEGFPPSFFLFPACSLFACHVFWYICEHENLDEIHQSLLSFTGVVLLLATVILFITYRHNLEKENEYLQAKNELESLQTQKEYYDILEHQNQQLMIYAHDAKKHMAAIQNLSTDADIQGYVQELSDQLKSYTSSCHSGNKTLDVIINRYQTECDIHGIAFEYDVKPCNLNNMEDVDLVSVLGNLMDNALDAAKKSSGKHLLLATTWRNDYSVIIVSNSCDTAPATIGNRLLTSKEDRKLHGFGLKSVRNTLKKYSGDFDWEYDAENHVFTITAMVGKKS